MEAVPGEEGGNQMSNQLFQQNLDDKKGPQPGGPYLIQMLFKEPVEMPDKEKNDCHNGEVHRINRVLLL